MLRNSSVRTIYLIFLFLSAYLSVEAVYAQQETSEYDLKAAFLYNFTQFVTWPSNVFTDPTSDFNICIYGQDPFGESLKNLIADENVKTHPIKIVQINEVHQFNSCHMLFIARDKIALIENLDSQLGSKSVLTIGDSIDFADRGGVIGFGLVEQRIKLRINLASANAKHLTISSKLLRLSEVIEQKNDL